LAICVGHLFVLSCLTAPVKLSMHHPAVNNMVDQGSMSAGVT